MKPQQAGFTLIELMLTLGVLSIGLVSIFTLLPGVSEFSREMRDQDRMQTFADAVFASVEWSLRSAESPDILQNEEKLAFQTLLGEQQLVFGSEEQPWPDTNGVEDWVPVFFYTLEVETNSVREVTVQLSVRPEFSNAARAFTRTVYPQVKAW
ncbi:prepilin-type N-terminal cleavage/methylation domain-containing protein [Kiritimatiellaeota bacterium B1221]|nr:prepilin-type N-terminal cleavage/methylation domain-containing protein [Kiritimatiellaeota bacterium B1221]